MDLIQHYDQIESLQDVANRLNKLIDNTFSPHPVDYPFVISVNGSDVALSADEAFTLSRCYLMDEKDFTVPVKVNAENDQ